MSAQLWLYKDGAETLGPVSENEIIDLVSSGSLSPSASVRTYGPGGVWFPLASWKPEHAGADTAPTSGAWRDTSTHPWRRYWARSLDYATVGALTWMLVGVVFYAASPTLAETFFTAFEGPAGRLVDMFLTVLVAIPGTALMIGLTGTSLGKWIFGVKVVGGDGKPIGFFRALKREIGVWIIGMGAAVPLVSLMTLLMAYNHLQDQRTTAWDKSVRSTVYHRPQGLLQTMLIVGGIAFLLILRVWLMRLGQTPG